MKKPKPIELSKVTLANKAHETLEKKESEDEMCYIKTCRIIPRVLGGMFLTVVSCCQRGGDDFILEVGSSIPGRDLPFSVDLDCRKKIKKFLQHLYMG